MTLCEVGETHMIQKNNIAKYILRIVFYEIFEQA